MKTNTKELLEQLIESVRADETFSSTVLLEDAATGSSIPAAHLTKIRKWTQKDIEPESIHTYPVLMIDTAPTRNMVIYTAESQKKTVKKWPGTTFLFNFHGISNGSIFGGSADHTLMAASQVARIYDAKVVSTPKGEIGTLAWFYTVEGVDEHVDSFIKKVDSGIIREVSIHISAPDGVICSICNDAFSKCFENSGTDHYPGDKYGKAICYMSTGVGGLVPLELSAVAVPGSVNAHVMSDDEVEDYPVVSLREALGGSDEAIQKIRQENNMRTKEQIAEARLKLVEAAKAAGVELREFIIKEDDSTKTLVESADINDLTKLREFLAVSEASKKCESCEHKMHEGACKVSECECKEGKESVDDDNPNDEKKGEKTNDDGTQGGKKQNASSLIGEQEECVVCGRGPVAGVQTEETVQVETLRTEFKGIVAALTEKSQAVVDAANVRTEEAETRAKDALAMFDDYIENVVTLAVKFGTKKSSEKEAYRETLAGLPYQAVKEIRESLRVHENAEVKTDVTKRLEQTASERAKLEFGTTKTVTDKDGRTSTTTQRARFGAK